VLAQPSSRRAGGTARGGGRADERAPIGVPWPADVGRARPSPRPLRVLDAGRCDPAEEARAARCGARTEGRRAHRPREQGNLFVELQDHGLVEQPIVNRILLGELARELDLPLVATNDATTSSATTRGAAGAAVHRRGRTLDGDGGRTTARGDVPEEPEEMAEALPRTTPRRSPTPCASPRCARWQAQARRAHAPRLPRRARCGARRPTEDEYFADSRAWGLEVRFETFKRQGKTVDERKYKDRLEVEIKVIQQMKFPGYFLIVQDFINWGKRNGVPVGPGRGSGAGSLVAYALRITDIDPHPLRPPLRALPEPRARVDARLRRRLLHAQARARHRLRARRSTARDSVGQIATFQVLKSKSVRARRGPRDGLPPETPTRIAKLVPTPCRARPSRSRRPWRRSPAQGDVRRREHPRPSSTSP
jgi:DNA polymerase-3 subunit alpha